MANKAFLDKLIEEPNEQMLYERESLILEVTEMINILMEDKGLTKTKLAEKLNVSISNISQMLNGTKNMTLGSIADILYHLGEKMTVGHASLNEEIFIREYPQKVKKERCYTPLSEYVMETQGQETSTKQAA